MKISQIPVGERPRERCLRTGPAHLSTRECLALLLGSGNRQAGCLNLAEHLLNRCGMGLADEELFSNFYRCVLARDLDFLKDVKGIGRAQLARLLAFCELTRRFMLEHQRCVEQKPAEEVALRGLERKMLKAIPLAARQATHEWLGFVGVTSSGGVGTLHIVQHGGHSAVTVDARYFFRRLLLVDATIFFVIHNHPRGGLHASEQDLRFTADLKRMSTMLGMRCLGHWIVTAVSHRRVDREQ